MCHRNSASLAAYIQDEAVEVRQRVCGVGQLARASLSRLALKSCLKRVVRLCRSLNVRLAQARNSAGSEGGFVSSTCFSTIDLLGAGAHECAVRARVPTFCRAVLCAIFERMCGVRPMRMLSSSLCLSRAGMYVLRARVLHRFRLSY